MVAEVKEESKIIIVTIGNFYTSSSVLRGWEEPKMLEVKANLEAEYDNRAQVPDHPEIFERWLKSAEEFREDCLREDRAVLDIPYGPSDRHTYDLFKAAENTLPAPRLALFVHGGYWRALDKSYFSHLARSLTSRGFDVAATNYRLCPSVAINDIIDDARSVAEHLFKTYGKKLLPYGHSAGGHLVSALMATDWEERGLPSDLITSGMIISGIYDLKPLLSISVNQDLHLTEQSAQASSTRFWPNVHIKNLAVVAGGDESPAFIGQSTDLYEGWKEKAETATLDIVERANHFTIVDPLADPNSELSRKLAELVTP